MFGVLSAAGGAQPVAADQRTVSVVSGKFAWQEAGVQAGVQAAPNPGAVADRSLQLWATPHGVIKAAIRNNAALGQLRNHVRAIPNQSDGNILFLADGILQNA